MHKVWGSVKESDGGYLVINILEGKNAHIQIHTTHTKKSMKVKKWYTDKEKQIAPTFD
jgi:hypothetical protein